jgi:hypothetical protein
MLTSSVQDNALNINPNPNPPEKDPRVDGETEPESERDVEQTGSVDSSCGCPALTFRGRSSH